MRDENRLKPKNSAVKFQQRQDAPNFQKNKKNQKQVICRSSKTRMTLDFKATLKATKQWINSFITLKTKQNKKTTTKKQQNISKMDPLLNY